MGDTSQVDFGDQPGNYLMHGEGEERTPDFSGWASKFGVKCSDGRTILPGAFAHQDKAKVPLVWQHGHNGPENVLGHAILENRDDGVYCYGYFNATERAKNAKQLLQHDDIDSLSIFANGLVEQAKKVAHGIIREVSLVLARANPGALIDNVVMAHSDGTMVSIEDEAIIYSGELLHEDAGAAPKQAVEAKKTPEELVAEHGEGDATVQEVYDGMTDEQKQVLHHMVGTALEESSATAAAHSASGDPNKEGLKTMSRNVFEEQNKQKQGGEQERVVLSHDALKGIERVAKQTGSLKAAVEEYALEHGIENLDVLFPDARSITQTPEFDQRRTEWVKKVVGGTNKTPFSRIKSVIADITHDEARARGYIKGSLKKEEFFGLMKRVTTPGTIYKKQKLDRDDIIDITDFDIVPWVKAEMRLMLDEELGRAVLIGDGRDVDDEDKVKDPQGSNEGAGIRSILHDDELYAATLNVNIDDAESTPTEIVDAIVEGMSLYKGSGTPTFFTTLPVLTKILLARDTLGRRLYRTASDVAAELMVDEIVTVEVMEQESDLVGIIVNLRDYTIGADRGGDVTMFDDFDIDFNQYKYLLETRLSGALTKIRSALIVKKVAGSAVLRTPVAPTFDTETSSVEITDVTGVDYYQVDSDGETVGAELTNGDGPYFVAEGEDFTVKAFAAAGSYLKNNVQNEWTFRGRATS